MGFNSAFKGLKAELNPICHLLALLWSHHILHVSRIRVKWQGKVQDIKMERTGRGRRRGTSRTCRLRFRVFVRPRIQKSGPYTVTKYWRFLVSSQRPGILSQNRRSAHVATSFSNHYQSPHYSTSCNLVM